MENKKISEARKKAKNKYDKKTYFRLSLLIRKDDEEIIEKLESVPSKNGYIINLIKEDIANKKAFEDVKKEFETLKTADK